MYVMLYYYIGVGMTCTLGGLIQYHVQFMCSIIPCLIYDQANVDYRIKNIGGAIAPPAPMVPTPMYCATMCVQDGLLWSQWGL